jgi:hypothetical protein
LIECKTQPAGGISVKDEWIRKVTERAAEVGRFPAIVTRRYKDQAAYAILPHRTIVRLTELGHGIWPSRGIQTKTRGLGIGFVLQEAALVGSYSWLFVEVFGTRANPTVDTYAVARFDMFQEYVRRTYGV